MEPLNIFYQKGDEIAMPLEEILAPCPAFALRERVGGGGSGGIRLGPPSKSGRCLLVIDPVRNIFATCLT